MAIFLKIASNQNILMTCKLLRNSSTYVASSSGANSFRRELLLFKKRQIYDLFLPRRNICAIVNNARNGKNRAILKNTSLTSWVKRSFRGDHIRCNKKKEDAILKFTDSNLGDKNKVQLSKKEVIRLFSLAKNEKWVLIAAVTCLLISSGVTMAVPYSLGRIMDIIFQESQSHTDIQEKLFKFCSILFVVFIFGGIANFGRVWLINSASLRIVRNIRRDVFSAILKQEIGWFDKKGSGELINRLTTDCHIVGHSLSQNISDGLRSLVMITVGSSMMVFTSAKLALISTCVVPVIVGLGALYGRYLRTITKVLLDKYADVMKYGEERITNVRMVKIFSKEEEETKTFVKKLCEALHIGYKEAFAKAIFYGLAGTSGNIITVTVLYYGGHLVVNDVLSMGALTSFILYAGYTAIAITGLSQFYSELNKGVGSAHRIWEILDRKYTIPSQFGIIPIKPSTGLIELDKVKFFYPARPKKLIFNDFSLMIEPSCTTAIVGKTGSGKTTIFTLLLRLYDPISGSIRLDGHDIKTLNPVWLRSVIGSVPQEPTLFSGSIRENILYGSNPGVPVSNAELRQAIEDAHVDEIIASLPDGLETKVGQKGVMLSGGQKQRIAIATALIRKPKILLFDEATSALDSASEQLVQHALEKAAQGRTVITIAHRLSTIRNANKIVVLKGGKVAEQGNYEELITRTGGIFKDLVEKQMNVDKKPPPTELSG